MKDEYEERRIDREIHRLGPGSDPFAAAMRATRMPMLITDPAQPDNPIIFVNDAFARLTGYTREETLGRNCRFLQGPGTSKEDVNKVRAAVEARQPIEIDLLNYRKDGTIFWNRLLISPVFDDGELTYFFASQLDVTRERTAGLSADRDQAETIMQQRISDLTASETRLQFILKAGGFGTWTLELPEARLVASSICKANFGRGPAETFTYDDLKAAIHPEDYEHWQRSVDACLKSQGDLHLEYRAYWPNGSIHWIEIRAQTLFDASGNPSMMSGVSMDITQRKEAEEYRALMTQELGHRIKNILATVQSVVVQSLRSDAPIKELRESVSQRISALGRSQDILTGKKWDIAGLRQTVERAIELFNQTGRISYTGPDLEISQSASASLTIALHELATNAVKYGALSNETGRVCIAWGITGDDFELTWTESGGPTVRKPSQTGFGSRMIERALGASMKGIAKIKYLPSGICFTLNTTIAALRHTDLSSNG